MIPAGKIIIIMMVNLNGISPRITSTIKREKRPPSPEDDDVIILSDNDSPSPPMNGLSHFKELDTDLLMVRKLALACQLLGFFFFPTAVRILCILIRRRAALQRGSASLSS